MTHKDMLHEALEVIADQEETIARLMQVVWHYTSARTTAEKMRIVKRFEHNGTVTKLSSARIAKKVG